jgi:hypothetical protein
MSSSSSSLIVDLDGTMACNSHRQHFIEGTKKDWSSFFANAHLDEPNLKIIELVRRLSQNSSSPIDIYIFTGRPDSIQSETENWLRRWVDFEFFLRMRRKKDFREDHIVKLEFATELKLTPDNVLCVIDDRKSVVEMWRKEGFTCLQVADNEF